MTSGRHYNDHVSEELSRRLNQFDFARIRAGLESGKQILANIDPTKRGPGRLAEKDNRALTALFDALSCTAFLKDSTQTDDFNIVFESLQTKRTLRIADPTPSIGMFIFDQDKYRHDYAKLGWDSLHHRITPQVFEWVIHDPLSENIGIARQTTDIGFLARFWLGVNKILGKLDERLIRESLRSMEVQPSIYHLALDHLRCDSEPVLICIISSLHLLLSKAPRDFWAAYGSISPTTVFEQIFNSPSFDRLLAKTPPAGDAQLPDLLAWTVEAISSLPSASQVDAARSLLSSLFTRLQSPAVAETSRVLACHAGLEVLACTLNTFTHSTYEVRPTTSLLLIENLQSLVHTHIHIVTTMAQLGSEEPSAQVWKGMALSILGRSIQLDCKVLDVELSALNGKQPLESAAKVHSEPIWQAILQMLQPGEVHLANIIISATTQLTGLDEYRLPRSAQPSTDPNVLKYNASYSRTMANVAKVLERLSDFRPTSLMGMYRDLTTARPLISAILSADPETHQAAIEVMKIATEKESRTEAVSECLEIAFNPVMKALTAAGSRIIKANNFGPIPQFIKMSRDVLRALSGSTGYLRNHSPMDLDDQKVLFNWWIHQWNSLNFIFNRIEQWAPKTRQTTEEMKEFCRDGMDYAKSLVDQISVFATAIKETSARNEEQGIEPAGGSGDASERLLKMVGRNVLGLIKMIRLKEEYLVEVIVKLLCKLLRKVFESGLEIDEDAALYINQALLPTSHRQHLKTMLTPQQKAELQRALHQNINEGLNIVDLTEDKPGQSAKKQSRLDGFVKDRGSGIPISNEHTSVPLKSQSEQSKAVLGQMKTQQLSKPQGPDFLERRKRDQEESQARRMRAAAAAKASLSAAVIRGEGSGMKGIHGVLDKDHAPVRSEIMVSSGDDSDDDSDVDETNTLVKMRKEKSKLGAEIDEARRRGLKANNGPVKKVKIQRSAKDLRARVEPNMDALYLDILNWDIFHDGDSPPSAQKCVKIANKFQDLDLYKRTFGPLLISEVWRSLVTAKDENTNKPVQVKVLNRLSVDKFLEVSTTIEKTTQQLPMFERDIVLLSRASDPIRSHGEPHCLARVERLSRKKDTIEVTFKVSREVSVVMTDCISPSCKIFAVKIADMTTTQREYAALSSLMYYDLCTEIMEAKPSPIRKYGEERIANMSSTYNLNKAQAQAILSATDNDGFTLIQGYVLTFLACRHQILTGVHVSGLPEQEKPRPS